MRIKEDNFILSTTRTYILIVLSALCYFIFAYYTQRHESTAIFTLYSLLFVSYLFILRTELSISQLIISGLIFRAIFIISVPSLSDDFYRYIWDGRLTAGGINPFDLFPAQVINNPVLDIKHINHELFMKLNSSDYYSVFPPVCQFTFWVSAIISDGNLLVGIIVIRLFILAAEIGIILLLQRMFRIYGFNQKFTAIYFLNPLVVIELAGNLHYEALMIFFVIATVYFMKKNKFIFAGSIFALAISTKILPLLLLPFIFKRIKWNQSLQFILATAVITVITFLPLLNSNFIYGFTRSLHLYFQKFEFNASFFYLFREAGFLVKGIDIIEIAGIALAAIAIIIIIIVAVKEKKEKHLLLGIFVWPLFIFFSLSTYVHSWYILPILAFSVFSRFRFPIVWTYFIFLTYLGYSESGYRENLWIVLMEYIILYAVVIYELITHKNKKPLVSLS